MRILTHQPNSNFSALAVNRQQAMRCKRLKSEQRLNPVNNANQWLSLSHDLERKIGRFLEQDMNSFFSMAKAISKRRTTRIFGFGDLLPCDASKMFKQNNTVIDFVDRLILQIEQYVELVERLEDNEKNKGTKHQDYLTGIIYGKKRKIGTRQFLLTGGLEQELVYLRRLEERAKEALLVVELEGFNAGSFPETIATVGGVGSEYMTSLLDMADLMANKVQWGNAQVMQEKVNSLHTKLLVNLSEILDVMHYLGVDKPDKHLASFRKLLVDAGQLHESMTSFTNNLQLKAEGKSVPKSRDIEFNINSITQLAQNLSREVSAFYNLESTVYIPERRALSPKEEKKRKEARVKKTYEPVDEFCAILKRLKARLGSLEKEFRVYREKGSDGGAVGRVTQAGKYLPAQPSTGKPSEVVHLRLEGDEFTGTPEPASRKINWSTASDDEVRNALAGMTSQEIKKLPMPAKMRMKKMQREGQLMSSS